AGGMMARMSMTGYQPSANSGATIGRRSPHDSTIVHRVPTMRSMPSRHHQRLSAVEWDRPIGAPSPVCDANASSNRTGVSGRSDIYARPDLYDMEYEGASNEDAHFFAGLLARIRPRRVLELACGSGRVTFTLAAALPKAEILGVDSSIEMLG